MKQHSIYSLQGRGMVRKHFVELIHSILKSRVHLLSTISTCFGNPVSDLCTLGMAICAFAGTGWLTRKTQGKYGAITLFGI